MTIKKLSKKKIKTKQIHKRRNAILRIAKTRKKKTNEGQKNIQKIKYFHNYFLFFLLLLSVLCECECFAKVFI